MNKVFCDKRKQKTKIYKNKNRHIRNKEQKMKMMKEKRILIFIAVLVLCFACVLALSACNFTAQQSQNGDDPDSGNGDEPTTCTHQGTTIEVSHKDATCIENGYTKFKCSQCGAEWSTTEKAHGHEYENVARKDATCTEDGWKAYKKCVHCDYSPNYTAILRTGHKYVGVNKKLPTCTTDGYASHFECKFCHQAEGAYEIYPKLGHDTEHFDKQDSTCDEIGWEAYDKCKVCGYSTYVEIPMHHYDANDVCIDCHKNMWDDYFVLTLINDETEYAVTGIKDGVVLPENVKIPSVHYDLPVTQISENAFGSIYSSDPITSVKSVTIGENVNSIANNAFTRLTNLESLTVLDMNKKFRSVNNCVIDRDTKTLLFGCNTSVIPSDGSVSSIGAYAFKGRTALTELIVPSGVTSIGDYAFCECTKLTSVSLPEGLISIGNQAFYTCTNIETVSFPKSLKTIGMAAFAACTKLNEVTLSGNLEKIDESAFSGCTSLAKVYISGNAVAIESFAFSNCTALEELVFGDGIQIIREGAFKETKLTAVHINDIEDWCGITFEKDSNPLTIAGKLYFGDELATEFEIPSGVTEINEYAFAGCTSVQKVTIPSSVMSIGEDAFAKCNQLTGVYITDVQKWCEIAFGSETANPLYYAHNLYLNGELVTEIEIPASTTSISAYAFSGCDVLTGVYISDLEAWCNISFGSETANPLYYAHNLYLNGELLTDLVIPGTLNHINYYNFINGSCFTSLTIPSSVITIGKAAFYGCSGLTTATIGESVTGIDDYAFYGCSGLTDLVIPDSVADIGAGAFNYCSGLASITLSAQLTNISDNIFAGCDNLSGITVANGNTKYHSAGNNIIETATNTLILGCKNSVIPNDGSVTNIASNAFSDCVGLTSLVIPDCVTSINVDSINNCPNLLSVTIGAGITEIDGSYFKGCNRLETVTVSSSNEKYKSENDCIIEKDGNKLVFCSTVGTIPDGVTTIGSYAFAYGVTPKSVTMPSSVTDLEEYAFYYCTNLGTIVFSDNIETIGERTVVECSGLKNITIGENTLRIHKRAFIECNNIERAKFVHYYLWYSTSSDIGLSLERNSSGHWVLVAVEKTPSRWVERTKGSQLTVTNEKENAELFVCNTWLYRRDSRG